MAEIKKGKLKASTLLEVIIAMVIILVIFSLAVGVYNNVLSASPSIKKQQAQAITEGMITRSINEENWNDEQTNQEGITLEKKVVPYASYPDLVVITITATTEGKVLNQSRQVVKKTTHE